MVPSTALCVLYAGINYYADTIGFGESTMFAKSANMQQSPLGVRYFVETGAQCSNGAPMAEYVDTIPKGIPGRVGQEMKAMGLPQLRGLGPGIVEDAASSLNPLPILDAAVTRWLCGNAKRFKCLLEMPRAALASRYGSQECLGKRSCRNGGRQASSDPLGL